MYGDKLIGLITKELLSRYWSQITVSAAGSSLTHLGVKQLCLQCEFELHIHNLTECRHVTP